MGLLTYLRNGKAYKLETWYTVYGGSSASSTCTVTSRLKPVGGCTACFFVFNILRLDCAFAPVGKTDDDFAETPKVYFMGAHVFWRFEIKCYS